MMCIFPYYCMIYRTSLLCLELAVTAILNSMKVGTVRHKGLLSLRIKELQVGPYQSSPLPIFDLCL